jgi:DNA-binding NarL/FixJ family response regulator
MDTIYVLLVDENPTFLRIAAQLLRNYYSEEVTVVGTSLGYEDAMQQAHLLKPHLILMGLDRNHPAGSQVVQRMRHAAPDSGIVVLGTLDIDTYRQDALHAGADAFLAKAALHEHLLSTIRQVVGRTATRNELEPYYLGFSELMLAYATA